MRSSGWLWKTPGCSGPRPGGPPRDRSRAHGTRHERRVRNPCENALAVTGTLINVGTVLVGTVLGTFLGTACRAADPRDRHALPRPRHAHHRGGRGVRAVPPAAVGPPGERGGHPRRDPARRHRRRAAQDRGRPVPRGGGPQAAVRPRPGPVRGGVRRRVAGVLRGARSPSSARSRTACSATTTCWRSSRCWTGSPPWPSRPRWGGAWVLGGHDPRVPGRAQPGRGGRGSAFTADDGRGAHRGRAGS